MKKVILSAVLACVVTFSCTACGNGQLQQQKEKNTAEFNSIVSAENQAKYNAEDFAVIEGLIADAVSATNSATSADAAKKILEDTLASIDNIKTIEQYKAEALKAQKAAALETINANLVSYIGSYVLNNAQTFAGQDMIDTEEEAYNIALRIESIDQKIERFKANTALFINAAVDGIEVLEMMEDFNYTIDEVLSHYEIASAGDLVSVINHMDSLIQGNDYVESDYSQAGWEAIQSALSDFEELKASGTYEQISDALDGFFAILTEYEQEDAVSEYLGYLESEFSDSDLLYEYGEHNDMSQIFALKQEAKDAIKASVKRADMIKALSDFADAMKQFTSSSDIEQDRIEAGMDAIINTYLADLQEYVDTIDLSALPTYWSNWAQSAIIEATQAVEEFDFNYDDFEEILEDLKEDIADVQSDYADFQSIITQAKNNLEMVKTMNEFILTAEGETKVAQLTAGVDAIVDTATDWIDLEDKTLAFLLENFKAPEAYEIWAQSSGIIEQVLPEVLYDLIEANSVNAELQTIISDVQSTITETIQELNSSNVLFDEDTYGDYALYNNIKDILGGDFEKVAFGTELLNEKTEKISEEIAELLVDLYGLTENEALAIVYDINGSGEIFSFTGSTEAEEGDGTLTSAIKKIYSQKDKLADLKSVLDNYADEFVDFAINIPTSVEDTLQAINGVLDQALIDMPLENTWAQMYDMMGANFYDSIQEIKDMLAMASQQLEGVDVTKATEDLLNLYNMIVDMIYTGSQSFSDVYATSDVIFAQLTEMAVSEDMFDAYQMTAAERAAAELELVNIVKDIKASVNAEVEGAEDIYAVYSQGCDELFTAIEAFMEAIDEKYMTYEEASELQNAIENTAMGFMAALQDRAIDVIGGGEVLTVNDIDAPLYHALDLEANIHFDNRQAVVDVINEFGAILNNATSVEELQDLDIAAALAEIDTLVDVYFDFAMDAYETFIADKTEMVKEMMAPQAEQYIEDYEALNELESGYAMQAQSYFQSVRAMALTLKSGVYEFATVADIEAQMAEYAEVIELFNIDTTNFTEEEATALALVINKMENFAANSENIQKERVALDELMDIAVEGLADHGFLLEAVMQNVYAGIVDIWSNLHGIEEDADVAEVFGDDAEALLSSIARIESMARSCNYIIYLNTDTPFASFAEMVEYLNQDILSEVSTLFDAVTEEVAEAEELANLRNNGVMQAQSIVEGFLNDALTIVSIENKDDVLALFNDVKASIMAAEDVDAIDEILTDLAEDIQELNEFEDYEAAALAAYKVEKIEVLNTMIENIELHYNAENVEAIRGLHADAIEAINDEDCDSKADVDAILSDFEDDKAAVETLREYYDFASTEIVAFNQFINSIDEDRFTVPTGATVEDVKEALMMQVSDFVYEFDAKADFSAAVNQIKKSLLNVSLTGYTNSNQVAFSNVSGTTLTESEAGVLVIDATSFNTVDATVFDAGAVEGTDVKYAVIKVTGDFSTTGASDALDITGDYSLVYAGSDNFAYVIIGFTGEQTSITLTYEVGEVSITYTVNIL